MIPGPKLVYSGLRRYRLAACSIHSLLYVSGQLESNDAIVSGVSDVQCFIEDRDSLRAVELLFTAAGATERLLFLSRCGKFEQRVQIGIDNIDVAFFINCNIFRHRELFRLKDVKIALGGIESRDKTEFARRNPLHFERVLPDHAENEDCGSH